MNKRLLFLSFIVLFLFTAFSLVQPPPGPPGPVAPYWNGVFPNKTPGASGAWTLEDPWPNISIPAPLRILPFPGTEDILVLNKLGEVWRVSLDHQTQDLVLDIKDRAFEGGEAGTTGIALHPEFGNPAAPDKQYVFIYYRHKPSITTSWNVPWDVGYNRLSKFRWEESTGTFNPDSEEVLIQQYDRHTWHNGGAMFFHPDDGFLYLAIGDEGDPKAVDIEKSTQKIDRALMSGLLRIDVDNDPALSHPIRRQPQPVEWGPVDPNWGSTFSQGYSIPNDNPWQDTNGGVLEEFFAIGLRSPYSVNFDPISSEIWLSDVGYITREEISIIEKGDNMQWPYMEGDTMPDPSTLDIPKPDNVIGVEKPPIHDYDRDFGGCIIGGSVYNGNLFPDLYGKYLFADYNKGRIMALKYNQETQETEREILIYNIETLGLNLPAGNGITGIFPQPDGEVLVTVLSFNSTDNSFNNPGKILRLNAQEITPDPSALLSELGIFTDMNTLEVAPGIIPYTVNSPLWSDGAVKKRWMAVPNDGIFDSADEQIKFNSRDDWTFPEGTVFIKHFDLPVSEEPSEVVKLETRFFIIGAEGKGYGLTYKWNEQGTDAELLPGAYEEEYTLYENDTPIGSQIWEFPSRGDCVSCHTSTANYVLGVNTHQLNGWYDYPELSAGMNQLEYLNSIGIFDQYINDPDRYSRAYAIDDESADLSLRIRSYLDANCASCHRPGGLPGVSLDLRFTTPLHLQNIINQPTQSNNSDASRMIVKPGDHADSEIWVRDASLTGNQMPPLARSIIDEVYIEYLAEWIDNLPSDAGTIDELLLYPNPTNEWLGIRVNDSWQPPFDIQIYNIKGQPVQQLTINTHAHFLNLSTTERGTYILVLKSTSGEERQRFVVR
jgi:uncharacterized repeat protein (TIGR03806 family)